MSVILTESGTGHAPGIDWVEGVIARSPAGVVLVFSDLPYEYRQKLDARSIPFVIIDPAGDPAPDVLPRSDRWLQVRVEHRRHSH